MAADRPLHGLGVEFGVDEIFPDFAWKDGQEPGVLTLNQAGFFQDTEGGWYMTRRAKSAQALEAEPTDLYQAKKPNYYNATQGAGIYFTNIPIAAIKVLYVGRKSKLPSELYVARMSPSEEEVLDATNSVKGRAAGHQAAALILRTMATVPFVPWPTPRMYDRLYGDVKLVTARPSAAQRWQPGLSLHLDSQVVKPRYAIVRDPQALEVVGHRSLNVKS